LTLLSASIFRLVHGAPDATLHSQNSKLEVTKVGANPTQSQALMLFLIAFTLLAVAMAGGGIIYLLGFLVFLGASIALFVKCKPWEHQEE
jgi:hypothetical protein